MFRGKKESCLGDITGPTPATEGNTLANPLHHFFSRNAKGRSPLGHDNVVKFSFDRARADCINTYATGSQLHRQTLCEADHASLCHVVCGTKSGWAYSVQ